MKICQRLVSSQDKISVAQPGKAPTLFLVHPEEMVVMEGPAQTSHCGHNPTGSLGLVSERAQAEGEVWGDARACDSRLLSL